MWEVEYLIDLFRPEFVIQIQLFHWSDPYLIIYNGPGRVIPFINF